MNIELTAGEVMKNLIITKKEVDEYTGLHKTDFKIKSLDTFADSVVKYYTTDSTTGYTLPWQRTHEDFLIRKGELTIVQGVSGHGKSMWLNQVALYLLKQTKVLIASFEMRPEITVTRMILQTGNSHPTEKYIREFCAKYGEQLFIYDQEGLTESVDIFSTLAYGAEVEKIDCFVIDSLMKVSDVPEDDYDKQKKFIDQLVTLCRDLQIHVFLVCHTRKTDEYEPPNAQNIMGSSHIRNLSDNIVCVYRNKAKERDIIIENVDPESLKFKPDCMVYVQKQRNFPSEPMWNFWFDKLTLRYRNQI